MKKTIAFLLAIVMMLTVCAFAESAKPSITISQIIAPSNNAAIAEDFVIKLVAVQEESQEKVVFDEIVEFVTVQNEPVANYFGEEVMTAAAEYLPEELDIATLVVDEFFQLTEENYEESYGEVTATFQFVTPYEDGTTLIAMVGVLPKDATAEDQADAANAAASEESTEESAMIWIPIPAVASEGLVQITFTEEVFAMLKENQCVCALLRAEDFETAVEEAA